MEEFSAALLITLAGQTKIAGAKNKGGLLANFPHFPKNKIFNDNLESCYSVLLKCLRWVL
jgi:hypothetical protein